MSLIKEIENPTEFWKSKNGMVKMSDMTEKHLQEAFNHAEHRYIQYHNTMLKYSDKVALFEIKMMQLKEEAKKRGVALESLCEKKEGSFDILRKYYKVAENISE